MRTSRLAWGVLFGVAVACGKSASQDEDAQLPPGSGGSVAASAASSSGGEVARAGEPNRGGVENPEDGGNGGEAPVPPCPNYAPDYCPGVPCVQRLTDPDLCGACHVACSPLSDCENGVCLEAPEVIASYPSCGKLLLLMRADRLYVLNQFSGLLKSASVNEQTLRWTDAGSNLTGATSFDVDAQYAWVVVGRQLARVPLINGVSLFSLSEASDIAGVAASGGKVSLAVGADIKQVDVLEPTSSTVVTTAEVGGRPEALAVDGDRLLFASPLANHIEEYSLSEGSQRRLVSGLGQLGVGHGALQVANGDLFWMNRWLYAAFIYGETAPTRLVAAARDGASVVAFAIDPQERVAYVATDDGRIEKSRFEDGEKGLEAAPLGEISER